MSLKEKNGVGKIEIIVVVVLSIAGLIIGSQMGASDGKAEAERVYQQ